MWQNNKCSKDKPIKKQSIYMRKILKENMVKGWKPLNITYIEISLFRSFFEKTVEKCGSNVKTIMRISEDTNKIRWYHE